MVQSRSPQNPAPRRFWEWGVLLIGGLGPLGWCPASGTVAVAVVGVPAIWLSGRYGMPLWAYLSATAVLILGGVGIHQIGDRILGEKDSRRLVLDELAGYAVAMIAVPPTWQLLLLGFCLERTLDIAKVWPANRVEERWPGGWGVVGDDVVAGVYTCVILHIVAHGMPRYPGI